MIQGENSREVPESRSKLLLFGNLIKKIYLHTKEERTLLENYKKYSVVKVFFFSLLFSAGMGERWGKGEEGARALASSARGKEEANPLF